MEHFLTGKRKKDSVLYITDETLAINRDGQAMRLLTTITYSV